jgi:hypothetical protein
MVAWIKTNLLPLPILFSALLISPGVLHDVFAQESQSRNQEYEKQRHEKRPQMSETKRQRADRDRMYITDQSVEGWLVVKLAARPGLNEVDVEVKDGVAVLTGKVASQQDKNRAVWLANSTMGVVSVRDQLKVDPALAKRKASDISDRELAKQVAQEIAGNIKGAKAGAGWWFDGWRVEGESNRWNLVVDVTDGHAILTGEVPNVNLMRKVVETAADVPGVRTVDSDLELPGFYGYWGYHPHASYGPYYPYLPPNLAVPYGDHPYSEAGRRGHRDEDQQQTRR